MTMKSYWLSKYALSEGIKVADGEPFKNDPEYIDCKGYWPGMKLGRDAFNSEGEARQAAEAMRLKKIASLRKQIAKLEKLEF